MHAVPTDRPRTARFWARYAAWSLDAACLLPVTLLLCSGSLHGALVDADAGWQTIREMLPRLVESTLTASQSSATLAAQLLADPQLSAASQHLQSALNGAVLVPSMLFAVLAALWSVGFESSHWQATPGKRALGLYVADTHDRRISWQRALGRFAAAGLSWVTLNLGHALAAFPPHLALHDHLSATRVYTRQLQVGLPYWARAWLALQALAFLTASAWAFLWLQAAMQAAVQQVMQGL